MRKFIIAFLTILSLSNEVMAQKLQFKIIQTTDVHGSFFPYDFINRKPQKGSLARVSSYVKEQRAKYGDRLILLENGDILQGQPTCYYSNYVNPKMPNLASSIINYMKYDAQCVGNHDIETGHPVYDKWIKELNCPVLGANMVDTKTGKPYALPYTIIEREGAKIAVLGLITPAIPNWLNESLWSGMHFDNMITSARYWVNLIQTTEKPDVLIGLFHSGKEGGIRTNEYVENASIAVAKEIPGFDIILFGHDHAQYADWITDNAGNKVLCLNPSSDAYLVSEATIELTKEKGNIVKKQITGGIVSMDNQPVDQDFMAHFKSEIDSINNFVGRKIGVFKKTIYSRDCYFGSAPFTDFIHNLQLKITQADVSFNAPLAFDISIRKGDVYVSDLFNLYKYENQIYVLRMTGKEIKDYLEMSYNLWCNTMTSPDDHIMLMKENKDVTHGQFGFKHLAFNFDSAAGINYEVDVTQPAGRKIHIISMNNGEPFDETKWYRVAMNSYRGNGGGELLTKGAGIPLPELKNRIIYESEHDQRYYLMKEIEKGGIMDPQANDNWRFVPEKWTRKALARDKALLFGEGRTK